MLAVTAAAIIPMITIAGSGIDISRVYLAKSRLQAACDSGVLAGRKAMTTVTYTSTARARAEAMFNFNFDPEDYQATGTQFSAQADAEGKLDGTARTTIPMIVMDFLGFGDKQITVNCSADIQVPNIDVVFVLDVTGSMTETIGGVQKIVSLRAATIDFYDAIAAAMAGNTRTRVRYGFVPYSQTVNGSELFVTNPNFTTLGQLPVTHLINTMTVQSRVANFNTPYTGNWIQDPNSTPTSFDQNFVSGNNASREPNVAVTATGTVMSNNDCALYGQNLSFTIDNSTNLRVWFPTLTSWPGGDGQGSSELYKPDGSNTWQSTVPTSGSGYTRATFSRVSATWNDNNGASTNQYRACTRRVTHTRFIRETGFRFTNWTYRPVEINTTNYRAGGSISYVSSINTSTAAVPTAGSYDMVELAQMPNQTGLTRSNASWNGCLEERTTTAATTFSPIPEAAKDLNYIEGGTSESMRWRPMMHDLTWLRTGTAHQTTTNNNSKPANACPSASMRNLREYPTRSAFTSYVNSLQANGNTYLDVGMIWGLRLISPQGMFADRNLTGPNGGQISRHIIFLTDGEPVSSATTYSSYGTEQTERRITGSTGVAAATLHARRFQALCDAERGRVAIWAIAFGTSVTGNMQSCADSGRAMQANNTTELRQAFARIANEVADLRLVQ
ncbi:Tad domain-containing protein [Alteraurantiacibacter palmitatis]|uniref:Tad domain-containing protein n=1 Tax=Alteraurantiacibacter palmitatis TaxID=2054628 RepID=A0ABV7EBG7_9SPHN